MTYEIFERSPAEVARIYGAPLGAAPDAPTTRARANAKGCFKFTKDTGAYNVEVGFTADRRVCYAMFEKKDKGAIEPIEARQILLQCAAAAEWTDITTSRMNTKTKKLEPAAGHRDYQYRELDPAKAVKKLLLARHQFRPSRLVVYSLAWQADIVRELGVKIV
jgi:hypothetical protein